LAQSLGPARVGPIATVATTAPVAINIPTVRSTANNRFDDMAPPGGGVHFTLLQVLGPAKVGPIATVATRAPVASRIPAVRRIANKRLADIFPSRRPFHRRKKDRNPEGGFYHNLSLKDKLPK